MVGSNSSPEEVMNNYTDVKIALKYAISEYLYNNYVGVLSEENVTDFTDWIEREDSPKFQIGKDKIITQLSKKPDLVWKLLLLLDLVKK